MLDLSKIKFLMANVGETVRIRIPELDRGKVDSGNITANIYKLGTKHIILNQLYTGNNFAVCKENFISVLEDAVKEICLREGSCKNCKLGKGNIAMFYIAIVEE